MLGMNYIECSKHTWQFSLILEDEVSGIIFLQVTTINQRHRPFPFMINQLVSSTIINLLKHTRALPFGLKFTSGAMSDND